MWLDNKRLLLALAVAAVLARATPAQTGANGQAVGQQVDASGNPQYIRLYSGLGTALPAGSAFLPTNGTAVNASTFPQTNGTVVTAPGAVVGNSAFPQPLTGSGNLVVAQQADGSLQFFRLYSGLNTAVAANSSFPQTALTGAGTAVPAYSSQGAGVAPNAGAANLTTPGNLLLNPGAAGTGSATPGYSSQGPGVAANGGFGAATAPGGLLNSGAPGPGSITSGANTQGTILVPGGTTTPIQGAGPTANGTAGYSSQGVGVAPNGAAGNTTTPGGLLNSGAPGPGSITSGANTQGTTLVPGGTATSSQGVGVVPNGAAGTVPAPGSLLLNSGAAGPGRMTSGTSSQGTGVAPNGGVGNLNNAPGSLLSNPVRPGPGSVAPGARVAPGAGAVRPAPGGVR